MAVNFYWQKTTPRNIYRGFSGRPASVRVGTWTDPLLRRGIERATGRNPARSEWAVGNGWMCICRDMHCRPRKPQENG